MVHAGSNDCWRSCGSSCGWEMRPRYGANGGVSRSRIGEMRSYSGFVVEGRLSAGLGAQLGESGSWTTAVASGPHGASADPDHESTASGGTERRPALQEGVVART